MAYLERFKNEVFYDKNLQEIANLYLDGLYKQQDALNAEFHYEYQVFWQEGLVKRYEALKRLYR